MTYEADVIESKPGPRGYLRYAICVLLFLTCCFNYIIKIMLSVAIVAMVKDDTNSTESSTAVHNHSSEDTCPGTPDTTVTNDKNGIFEWDEVMQGSILSSYFYGYVATQFVGGWSADRFGPRWVIGIGMLCTGLSSMLCPVAANIDPMVFMVLRAIQGAFSGVLLPASNVMMSRWYSLHERPRIAGIVLTANYAGSLIAMSVSGLLVTWLGWMSVFYVFGGFCVSFILPWFYFSYDDPEVHPRISNDEKEYIVMNRTADSGQTAEEKAIEAEEKKKLPIPWFSILTSVPFWACVFMHGGSTWLNYTLMTELPTFCSKILHFNIKNSGLISALPYLFAWVFGSIFGIVSGWLRSKGYVSQLTAYKIFNGIGSIGPGICLLVITLLHCNATAIVACLIVTATLKCSFYGGSLTNVLDLAPNFAGTTSGILYTCINMTGIITPKVTGAITNGHQTLSRWHNVFYIAIAVCVGPYISYLIFGSVEEQSWNKPKLEEEKKKDKTKERI